MLKSDDGLYINIHEAALVNYPAMFLNVDTKRLLPHQPAGARCYRRQSLPAGAGAHALAHHCSSDNAPAVLASKLILNLNEPSKITDTSWIKPQKFVGVWWEMQVGRASWNYADTTNIKLAGTNWSKLKPNGRHGLTRPT